LHKLYKAQIQSFSCAKKEGGVLWRGGLKGRRLEGKEAFLRERGRLNGRRFRGEGG